MRTATKTTTGYSTTQIALYWIIAALIVVQIVSSDSMKMSLEASRSGGGVSDSEALLTDIHVVFGIAVFVLAAVRVALRLRRGAPALPEDEHPLLSRRKRQLSHLPQARPWVSG